VDGKEVANFCDWSVYGRNPSHRPSKKDTLAAYGELRAWDFKDACWDLVHKGIETSLVSKDPLRQALSVLHRKVGRRRLALIAARPKIHPLVRFMVELRAGVAGAPSDKSLARAHEG
jgi:hypothetical protein